MDDKVKTALASLKSALAAFQKEEVTRAEAMEWWERAREANRRRIPDASVREMLGRCRQTGDV